MDDITGMLIRLLMYLVSFVLVLTFLALMPDVKLPITFVGRNTMGIYFFPLSGYDRDERTVSSEHSGDAECVGTVRCIMDICTASWKQARYPLFIMGVLNLIILISLKRKNRSRMKDWKMRL